RYASRNPSTNLTVQLHYKLKVGDSDVPLTGILDDCFCDIESIDVFNNFKIYPNIRKLTERDYFRYYKVSMYANPPPQWGL
ncbi:hypothetical protein JZ751_026921, partial [Albula glossodonta]